MTPTLARMVGARAGALPKPIKWYSVPQFFRYEKPQRGRGREFIQWNVDVVGSAERAADAEAIAVALRALEILGVGAADVVLRLNDRSLVSRLLRGLDIGEAEEPQVLACVDKLERDEHAAERLAGLLGESRAAEIRGWCERFPAERAEELAPLLEALSDFGLADWVEPAFGVVRGLAYYTGPVWEIFARGRKLRSIAGGGRYDGLIAELGGPPLEALGFGMGDMVLGELLRDLGRVPEPPPRADVFVVPIGAEMLGAARQVLARLRQRGLSADGPYTALRVGRALKAADAAGARRAVLVGADEWADGCVRVKEMQSGEERVVPLDELD
jgi:histidyl-tRNA synthetase